MVFRSVKRDALVIGFDGQKSGLRLSLQMGMQDFQIVEKPTL